METKKKSGAKPMPNLAVLTNIQGARTGFVRKGAQVVPMITLRAKGSEPVQLTLENFTQIYKGLCQCWPEVSALRKAAKTYNQALRNNKGQCPPEVTEFIRAQFPRVASGELSKNGGVMINLKA